MRLAKAVFVELTLTKGQRGGFARLCPSWLYTCEAPSHQAGDVRFESGGSPLLMAKRRNVSETRQGPRKADGTIIFAESFVGSGQFAGLFREGMGLVEATAAYLDGQGRAR
jgi:hypothetical protein